MHWLRVIRDGLRELGVRAVYVADPRAPLPLAGDELPAVVIVPTGGQSWHGVAGNPLAIRTVEGTSSWPYDCELVWWHEETYTLTMYVLSDPDASWGQDGSAWDLARRIAFWFEGLGREALRSAGVVVRTVGVPVPTVELSADTTTWSQAKCALDVVLAVAAVARQRVETVESVALSALYNDGATTQEREFTVPNGR